MLNKIIWNRKIAKRYKSFYTKGTKKLIKLWILIIKFTSVIFKLFFIAESKVLADTSIYYYINLMQSNCNADIKQFKFESKFNSIWLHENVKKID